MTEKKSKTSAAKTDADRRKREIRRDRNDNDRLSKRAVKK